jgi:hypothetical protein
MRQEAQALTNPISKKAKFVEIEEDDKRLDALYEAIFTTKNEI